MTSSDIRSLIIPLSLGSAASVVMERERWAGLQGERLSLVATADVAWLLVQAVVAVLAPASASAASWAWAIGGVLAVLLGRGAAHGARAVPFDGPRRRHRPRWGIEYIVAAGNLQLVLLVLPLVAGLQSTGSLRAAVSLLGFSTIAATSVHQLGMQRLHLMAGDTSAVQRGARVVSVAAVVAVGLLTVPILLVPRSAGLALLGPTWASARVLLPVMILHRLVVSAAMGPVVALRVMDRSDKLLRDRLVLGGFLVVAAMIAGQLGGAVAVSRTMLTFAVLTTAVWFGRISPKEPASGG